MTERVESLTALFDAAAKGGSDAVMSAVCGLRDLFRALSDPAFFGADPAATAALIEAIARAAPAVSAEVEPRMPAEAVHLGMAAAAGLASLFARPANSFDNDAWAQLHADRADHVALLADELDALFRRQRIDARGDVFRRTIVVRRALQAEPAGEPLH